MSAPSAEPATAPEPALVLTFEISSMDEVRHTKLTRTSGEIIKIGSDSRSDLFIPNASRMHAILEMPLIKIAPPTPLPLVLLDLGAGLGTTLNNQPAARAAFVQGDTIGIANSLIKLKEVRPVEPVPASAAASAPTAAPAPTVAAAPPPAAVPPPAACAPTLRKYVEIEEKTVFEVIANSDRTEGRGTPQSLGYYATANQAQLAARGEGTMGTCARVVPRVVQVIAIVEVKDEPADPQGTSTHTKMSERWFILGAEVHETFVDPKHARERALAKLTKEERALLGLD